MASPKEVTLKPFSLAYDAAALREDLADAMIKWLSLNDITSSSLDLFFNNSDTGFGKSRLYLSKIARVSSG